MARRSTEWRDEAAAKLAASVVEDDFAGIGTALILEDARPDVRLALEEQGTVVSSWWRRARDGGEATAWPPEGPFDLVALRLPKGKDELEMAVHAALGRLSGEGRLLVYGANDEGIRSTAKKLAPLVGKMANLKSGGHCRVLATVSGAATVTPRASLSDWRTEFDVELAGVSRSWVSYPGLFAHGRVDSGTKLLLDSLPDFAEDAQALDFGCGSGLIAAAFLGRHPRGGVTCLDVDAVALEAVSANVPSARRLCQRDLSAEGAYDCILSNPPYHEGKAQSFSTVRELIFGAPRLLRAAGQLVFVAQRQADVLEWCREVFDEVTILAEDNTFRVISCHHPS